MTEDEMVGWHHRLNGRAFSKLREIVKDREARQAGVHGSRRVGRDGNRTTPAPSLLFRNTRRQQA